MSVKKLTIGKHGYRGDRDSLLSIKYNKKYKEVLNCGNAIFTRLYFHKCKKCVIQNIVNREFKKSYTINGDFYEISFDKEERIDHTYHEVIVKKMTVSLYKQLKYDDNGEIRYIKIHVDVERNNAYNIY